MINYRCIYKFIIIYIYVATYVFKIIYIYIYMYLFHVLTQIGIGHAFNLCRYEQKHAVSV